MSDWISVNDKLPEMEQIVLVCYPSYNGKPNYSWGARVDGDDGWLWGIGSRGHIALDFDAAWNDIEADDDYPVQFWKPLDKPPALEPPK